MDIQQGAYPWLGDVNAKPAFALQISSHPPYHFPTPVYQQIEVLRCQRCRGRRSSSYHRGYREDLATHPPIGICSRRNTKCAAAKADLEFSRALHHFQVYELPVN
ncbi:unnamed protein product [Penicillium camemberti]|uniref:Str. FM013 n=1 Tax=Penicillium camemberti (strain FM 013) TaxID=1429867 RepID=A0A0G4PVN9_PENC3|nr:unnamed protein product [Penicillium camemberti]